MNRMKPLHPGVMVRENIKELGLSITKTADIMKISKQQLHRIIKGTNPITSETAYRLGLLFGNGARFWIALQAHYDAFMIEHAYKTDTAKKNIEKEIVRELETV